MLVRTTSGLRSSLGSTLDSAAALSTASQSRFERAASRERREWRRTYAPIRCFEGPARAVHLRRWWGLGGGGDREPASLFFARRRSTGGAGVLVLLLLGAPRLGRRGGPRRGLLPEHPLVEPFPSGAVVQPRLWVGRGGGPGAAGRRAAHRLEAARRVPSASVPPLPVLPERSVPALAHGESELGPPAVPASFSPHFSSPPRPRRPARRTSRPVPRRSRRARRDAAHREAADEPVRHSLRARLRHHGSAAREDARVLAVHGVVRGLLRAHPAAAARGPRGGAVELLVQPTRHLLVRLLLGLAPVTSAAARGSPRRLGLGRGPGLRRRACSASTGWGFSASARASASRASSLTRATFAGDAGLTPRNARACRRANPWRTTPPRRGFCVDANGEVYAPSFPLQTRPFSLDESFEPPGLAARASARGAWS